MTPDQLNRIERKLDRILALLDAAPHTDTPPAASNDNINPQAVADMVATLKPGRWPTYMLLGKLGADQTRGNTYRLSKILRSMGFADYRAQTARGFKVTT